MCFPFNLMSFSQPSQYGYYCISQVRHGGQRGMRSFTRSVMQS